MALDTSYRLCPNQPFSHNSTPTTPHPGGCLLPLAEITCNPPTISTEPLTVSPLLLSSPSLYTTPLQTSLHTATVMCSVELFSNAMNAL